MRAIFFAHSACSPPLLKFTGIVVSIGIGVLMPLNHRSAAAPGNETVHYLGGAWTSLNAEAEVTEHNGWCVGGANRRDCLRSGGQAAIAACGCGSLAGWNLGPN